MIYLKETLMEALESQKANSAEVSEADVTEVRRENKPYDSINNDKWEWES